MGEEFEELTVEIMVESTDREDDGERFLFHLTIVRLSFVESARGVRDRALLTIGIDVEENTTESQRTYVCCHTERQLFVIMSEHRSGN